MGLPSLLRFLGSKRKDLPPPPAPAVDAALSNEAKAREAAARVRSGHTTIVENVSPQFAVRVMVPTQYKAQLLVVIQAIAAARREGVPIETLHQATNGLLQRMKMAAKGHACPGGSCGVIRRGHVDEREKSPAQELSNDSGAAS